tara:strand:+ start:113 stop:319 length:207 start_codon:yes stop_codon:yes gene_type:complete
MPLLQVDQLEQMVVQAVVEEEIALLFVVEQEIHLPLAHLKVIMVETLEDHLLVVLVVAEVQSLPVVMV